MSTLSRTVAVLRRVVHELDADCLDPHDAVDELTLFAEVERLGAAGKTLVARRIHESKIWQHEGHASAAHLVAAASGTSIGEGHRVVQTARHLRDLSCTEDELRAGQLSQVQAHVVSEAAAAAPDRERDLLACAGSDGLQGLRDEAARVRAAAKTEDDEEDDHQQLVRGRRLRHWTGADGYGYGEWRLPPESQARVVARLRAEQDRIFREHRKSGEREDPEAYAADALMRLVDGTATAPPARTTVIVRVDAERLQRDGSDTDGICEIAGIGPVPVSVARQALGNDAMVKLVVTKGVDVLNVTHIGRTRTAAVQTALDWLYDECSVVGCHRRVSIEVHHTDAFRFTGHTRLDELAPLCKFHHRLVERDRYGLDKRPDGEFDLVAPGCPSSHDDRAPP